MKINVEECKSVLADLEKASGADRELDAKILTVLLGMQDLGYVYEIDDWYYSLDGDEINPPFPSPTGSLDATIALVQRVLPGWAWSVFDDGHAWLWPDQKRDLLAGFQARASTTPIALLTTMFRALIAQMEKADD